MTKTYNQTKIRYATDELADSNFVKEEDYKRLQEEVEILRAERSHWYHMYNNALDERPDI